MVAKEKGRGTKVSSKWWTKYTQNELPSPLDEISLTWSEDLLGSKNVILEGPIDEKVFYKLTELLEEQVTTDPFNGYRLVPAGGTEAMSNLAHLSKNHNKKCFLVNDSDTAGLEEKTRLAGESFHCDDLKSLSGSTIFNIVTIEDLLPKDLYIDELNKLGKKTFSTIWKEVSNLHGIGTLGIIEAIRVRMNRNGLAQNEIKNFLDNYKYALAIGVINVLNLEDYGDNDQKEAIKMLFTNLSAKLD